MSRIALAAVAVVVACGSRGSPAPAAQDLAASAPQPAACIEPAIIDTLHDPGRHDATLAALYAQMRPRQVALALGAALDCGDGPLRLGILRVLAREGYRLDAALPAVARRIDDPDPAQARAALDALERVGAADTPDGEATKALLARVGRVAMTPERAQILRVLGRIHTTVEAYPLLARSLADPDVEIRRAAVDALWHLADRHPRELPPGAVDAVIEATKERDPQVHAVAMRTLGRLRDPRAAAFLSDALVDPAADPTLVAGALAEAGPHARAAEARLAAIVAADDRPMAARAAAAYALGQSGADAEDTIAALVAARLLPEEHLIESMTTDGREELRWAADGALRALAAAPASSRRVARVLLARMGTNKDVLGILCETAREVELIAPKLVALGRGGESIGGSIAHCLRDRGALAKAALPQLVKETRDADAYRREAAAVGLGAIGARSAVPALVAQLARRADADRDVPAVLRALARIGAKADRAAIAAWLYRPCVGAAAAVALVATGTDVAAGTQRLDELLVSAEPAERRCAVAELAAIVADPRVAAQRARLGALLADPAWDVRVAAATAAGKLGPAAEPFLPALIARLQRYDTFMEWKAIADTLAAMGAAALPAFPHLVRALVRDGANARPFWPAFVSILRAHPETADQLRAALADEGYLLRLEGELVIGLAQTAP